MIKMKNSIQCVPAFMLLGAVIIACGPNEETEGPVQTINLDYMDSTVRPQDDFFQFVNGNWIDQTEIPADQGRWGSFNELREFNNEAVLKVLEKAMTDPEFGEGTDQMKAVDFYQIGMDSLLAEERGAAPLQSWFEEIEQIKDVETLQQYLEKRQQYGGGGFFSLGVTTDLKDSERMALYITQGGLGLPDRDYYLGANEKFEEIKEK